MLIFLAKFPLIYGVGYLLMASGYFSIPLLLAGFMFPLLVIFLKAVGIVLTSGELFAARRVKGSSREGLGTGSAESGAASEVGLEPSRGVRSARSFGNGKLVLFLSILLALSLSLIPSLAFAAEEKHEEGAPELPNIIILLVKGVGHTGWTEFLEKYQNIFFSWLIIIILCIIGYLASRKPGMIPGKLQNGVELVVEGLENFIVGLLGERGRKLVPFLGTLFIYIFSMNLFGLIPGMKSPSSSLSTTAALGITVFVYVQYTGIRNLGFLGYLHHMAGSPRDAISWAMVPIMLPVHVIGEFVKPVSLSCRLFGNIFGEDILIAVFVGLGVTVLSFLHLPIGIPLQVPFIFLAMLTSAIQALIFTLLSAIYFLLMFPHEESH